MSNVHRIHRCLPGGLPAMLQLSEVIAAVRLDAKASRRRRRVSGQICAFPASIAAPADARAALPVSLPRRPIRSSRPSPGVSASLDKAMNAPCAAGMRGLDPKTDRPVEATFR